MKDNIINCLDVISTIITIIGIGLLIGGAMTLRAQRDKAYKATSILSDCCRNMKDAYGDKDSICIYYNNIAIKEGIENIFTNYYFCY